MDAIEFLNKERRKARAALGRVVQAAADERGELWEELEPELAAHEKLEDECLYAPLADDEAWMRDPRAVDWRQRHHDGVNAIEGLIDEIDDLDPEDASWLTKVKGVQTCLEKHIEEEEQEIFARISKVWPASRSRRAGAEMQEMKDRNAGRKS